MVKHHEGKIAPVEYDPSWVVKLAEEQIPEEVEVIENLKKCTTIIGYCDCGCGSPYFIDPKSEKWNFDYNKILEKDSNGNIILDIMRDKKIGSFEFI